MATQVEVADHGQGGVMMGVVYPSLCWLVYAIGCILKTIALAFLRLLHLLYRPIAFTLQPVVYLGHFLLACLFLPFKAVVKFETLYIYLSIAALVGLAGGLIISLISRKINGTLLAPRPIKTKVRSAKDYRQQKQKQKRKDAIPTLMLPYSPEQVNGTSSGHVSPGYASPSDGIRRKIGLLSTTILEEEEDSEF